MAAEVAGVVVEGAGSDVTGGDGQCCAETGFEEEEEEGATNGPETDMLEKEEAALEEAALLPLLPVLVLPALSLCLS